MIPSRLRRGLLALPLVALLAAGCAERDEHAGTKYYRIHVTDPRGKFISEWIAKGPVKRTELGYRFNAVERHTAPPYPQELHYPHGRPIEVSGPNMIVTRCGEPLWHYDYDPAE